MPQSFLGAGSIGIGGFGETETELTVTFVEFPVKIEVWCDVVELLDDDKFTNVGVGVETKCVDVKFNWCCCCWWGCCCWCVCNVLLFTVKGLIACGRIN